MGTKDFTEDYIKYLERNNANLQNQSVRIKEFETRLLNKELKNKEYELAVEDIRNICRSTCEAIDNYFENFSATMESLRNVLMWKSQLLQVPQRLIVALNPEINEDNLTTGSSNSDNAFFTVNDNNQSKNVKKCGMAKVCPMIKGHVISTPRIHLNRVNGDIGPQSRRPLAAALSPILEHSPEKSPHDISSPIFRNIRIPLHRLRIKNDSYKTDGSPKINFTRRKCPGFELRKRYSTMGINERFRIMRERRAEIVNEGKNEDISKDGDCINEETSNYATEVPENADTDGQNIPEDIDPLEGPSWLLEKQSRSEGSDSGLSSLQCGYVNCRRLDYHRSGRFINGEDKKDLLNVNDDAQMGNFELYTGNSDAIDDNSFPLEKQPTEKNSIIENEESSSEHSSSLIVATSKPEDYDELGNVVTTGSHANCLSFEYPSATSLGRKSVHHVENSPALSERKPVLESSARSKKSSGRDFFGSGRKNSKDKLLLNCTVNLKKLRSSGESDTPKPTSKRKLAVSKKRKPSNRYSSKMVTPPTASPLRAKRRAAEQCIVNKVWLDVTPRWESKIVQEAQSRRRATSRNSKNKKSKAKNSGR